jgi:anti-sigma B factor antagonist
MKLGDVQFTRRTDVLVAELAGEVDMSNAEGIGQAIVETTSNRESTVVLDLSTLHYLDSAGIQLLFKLREQLRARCQMLALVIPARSASNDALRLAGVTSHVEMFETLEDALRSAAKAGSDQDAGTG